MSVGEFCYQYQMDMLSWKQALNRCRGKGADLANIHSEKEDTAVKQYLQEQG